MELLKSVKYRGLRVNARIDDYEQSPVNVAQVFVGEEASNVTLTASAADKANR